MQLERIRNGRRTDNAYLERTHRTHDEEFYVPSLTRISNLHDHFLLALQRTYLFNCSCAHFGRQMNSETPIERAKDSFPWIAEHFYLLLPLILDDLCTGNLLLDGQDLAAAYSSPALFSLCYQGCSSTRVRSRLAPDSLLKANPAQLYSLSLVRPALLT